MDEKIKNLVAIVGEKMAQTIWAIPQYEWYHWANSHLEFLRGDHDGDMIKYTFHHNGYNRDLGPFQMTVWVDPLNWGYQEAVIRSLKTQIEVDLF